MTRRMIVPRTSIAMVVVILVMLDGGLAQTTDLFVFAGQSNALGYGANPAVVPPELAHLLAPQTDVLFFYEKGGVNRISSGGVLTLLQPQDDPDHWAFAASSGFGPELKAGRDLADGQATQVAILAFAINGSDLASYWGPSAPGGLYSELCQHVANASGMLAAQGRTTRLAGVFWMQGESDASQSSHAESYAENLAEFILQLRSDLDMPTLPFGIGRISAQIDLSDFPFRDVVRTAQESVAVSVERTFLVDTDDLTLCGDQLHFDATAELELGARFAQAYLEDRDHDGEADAIDNCPGVYNPDQLDEDDDGTGDACECNDLTDWTIDFGSWSLESALAEAASLGHERIGIVAGSTTETLTISQEIEVIACDGLVTIGE